MDRDEKMALFRKLKAEVESDEKFPADEAIGAVGPKASDEAADSQHRRETKELLTHVRTGLLTLDQAVRIFLRR